MMKAMESLQNLTKEWRQMGLLRSDIIEVFVSLMVQAADEQDDPDEYIQQIKNLIDVTFRLPAEDRSFMFDESH